MKCNFLSTRQGETRLDNFKEWLFTIEFDNFNVFI